MNSRNSERSPEAENYTIRRFLAAHDAHANHGAVLAGNFGDGYLLRHNAGFQSVRLAALASGFTFSNESNLAYDVLPLVELDKILDRRRIPYVDNVSALRHLVLRAGAEVVLSEVAYALKRNLVFHESCHAVVRTLLDRHAIWSQSEKHLVRRTLLEESAVNACETLLVSSVLESVHLNFLKFNSYVLPVDEREDLIRLRRELGYRRLNRFVIATYLLANHLRTDLASADFDRCLDFADVATDEVGPITRDRLARVAAIAFRLNPRFLRTTASLQFKMRGYGTRPEDLPLVDPFDDRDALVASLDVLERVGEPLSIAREGA